MRHRAAAALLVAVTACGGGNGDARPSAVPPSAPSSAPPASADPTARLVRAAIARTLAACPCGVRLEVEAFVSRQRDYDVALVGVYDARTRSAAFTEPYVAGFESRAVGGTVYVKGRNGWLRLDATRLPAEARSVLVPMALADPGIAFAVASAAVSAATTSPSAYAVRIDTAVAAAAAGPTYAPLLSRLLTADASVRANRDGTLTISFRTKGGTPVAVRLDVIALHRPAAPVTAPARAATAEVTTYAF